MVFPVRGSPAIPIRMIVLTDDGSTMLAAGRRRLDDARRGPATGQGYFEFAICDVEFSIPHRTQNKTHPNCAFHNS